jgi:hypothetical protein
MLSWHPGICRRPSHRRSPAASGLAPLLLGVLAAAIAGAVGAGASAASISGLSWASGGACWSAGWERYRGRPSDIYITFTPHKTFSDVAPHVQYVIGKYRAKAGRISLGLSMLTEDTRGQWRRCIDGQFDQYFLAVGTLLRANGLGHTIIRLGWEANGSGFPWNILGQVKLYKACFRHQVRLLKSVAPGLQID